VLAIGGHLKQAFYDLIVNAAEAMPNGGRLIIRTRAEENGNQPTRVLIDFIDNGPGISESEAKLIFEPFYSTKRTSLGLGLAISYSIVERHGGALSVSSSANGSTFQVTLPAAQALLP
jgi:signal transduction histidine kinase